MYQMRRNYSRLSQDAETPSYWWVYLLIALVVLGGILVFVFVDEPCVHGTGTDCVCDIGWTGKACDQKQSYMEQEFSIDLKGQPLTDQVKEGIVEAIAESTGIQDLTFT